MGQPPSSLLFVVGSRRLAGRTPCSLRSRHDHQSRVPWLRSCSAAYSSADWPLRRQLRTSSRHAARERGPRFVSDFPDCLVFMRPKVDRAANPRTQAAGKGLTLYEAAGSAEQPPQPVAGTAGSQHGVSARICAMATTGDSSAHRAHSRFPDGTPAIPALRPGWNHSRGAAKNGRVRRLETTLLRRHASCLRVRHDSPAWPCRTRVCNRDCFRARARDRVGG